jgi:hypothetical protein
VPAGDGAVPAAAGSTILDVDNAGQIDAGVDGVRIDQGVTVSGSITNGIGASIKGAGANDPGEESDGIEISGVGTTVNGGILKEGTVTADFAGIHIQSGANIQGDITNAAGGSIFTDGHGIEVRVDSVVTGDLTNAGSITSTGGIGIHVTEDSRVDGSVINEASGVIAPDDNSIRIANGSFVANHVVNEGTFPINNSVGMRIANAHVGGDVRNGATGVISSVFGVSVDRGSAVDGKISNTGVIDGPGAGFNVAGASIVAGPIENENTIDSAISLSVSTDSVTGDVNISGTMTGNLYAAGDDGAGNGIDVTNTGAIDLLAPFVFPINAEPLLPPPPYLVHSLVSGDYTQTADGSLAMTLLTFSQYDVFGVDPFSILGDADIAVELVLDFDPSFLFEPFDRFTLIRVGDTRTGLFSTYADDDLVSSFGPGRDLYIDYTDEGDIELYTTYTAPAPSSLALMAMGLMGWSVRRRRSRFRVVERPL